MQESNFCKQKKSEFFGKKYEKIEKMQISLKKFRYKACFVVFVAVVSTVYIFKLRAVKANKL